jgi:hypothetical protein
MSVKTLCLFLVALSILFMSMGGFLDMLESSKISKEHFWHDGMFLLLLAIFILDYNR